jgi:hypothetical protein
VKISHIGIDVSSMFGEIAIEFAAFDVDGRVLKYLTLITLQVLSQWLVM